MSLAEYEDFVFTAGLLDRPDPVAAWKQVSERQQRLVDFLNGKKRLPRRRRQRHRRAHERRRADLDQLRRPREFPRRRSLHRPGDRQRRTARSTSASPPSTTAASATA